MEQVLQWHILISIDNESACIVNFDMIVIGGIDFNLWFSQAPIGLRYAIKVDDKIRHYHEKDPNNKERINDI